MQDLGTVAKDVDFDFEAVELAIYRGLALRS